MSRKIIYLINPIAGTRGKSPLRDLIVKKTSEKKIDFEIIDTRASGDYQFLTQKIKKEGITDVVVCGGDGTVSAVAGHLIGTAVNIGIVPMGSGNGLALAAKIPTRPARALDLVLTGKASFIDGFYVNRAFSCMLCGIGFDAQVAHEFARYKKRGLQTYIKVATIEFFRTRSHHFDISLNNQSLSVDAFFISIANGNQFGNNFTIAPKASMTDGLLDVVIVKKMSKFLLPFSVLNQVRGANPLQNIDDHLEKKRIVYFQTAALTIYNRDAAPLHIDGDAKATAEKFEIRTVPRAIRLIRPRGWAILLS